MNYIPRLTKPEDKNPYYNTKSNGGYSNAIVGKPADSGCNVLSNCVGYAFGRFNEITGSTAMPYLKPVNAEQFMRYKGTLKTGSTPKLGACMVWQKGTTAISDGTGHVAIVEEVHSSTEVVTSESYYGGKAFTTLTRKKGTGLWGEKSPYKFLGFIYQPVEFEAAKPVIYKASDLSYSSELTGTYKTTFALNMRATPGMAGKVLTTIPKGTAVTVSGVYTFVNSVNWFFVQYKTYTGFCSADYLQKT